MKPGTKHRKLEQLRRIRGCLMETARLMREPVPHYTPDAVTDRIVCDCVAAARRVNRRLVALKRLPPHIRKLMAGLDRAVARFRSTFAWLRAVCQRNPEAMCGGSTSSPLVSPPTRASWTRSKDRAARDTPS